MSRPVMEMLYLLPYITGHDRVTEKFGIGGGGGVGCGEGDVRIKYWYWYQPLRQVTAPMAQKQEVSLYWKGMEALSSNQALTYVKYKHITDLNFTRNSS